MYCKKCKRDVGNIQFCENCGAETIPTPGAETREETAATAASTEVGFSMPKVTIPKLSIKSILGITFVVLLVIAILIGYSKGASYSKPDVTAKRYFNALVSGQYDKAYKMLEGTDDKFLSEKYFKSYVESLKIKDKQLINLKASQMPTQDNYDIFGLNQSQKKDLLATSETRVFQVQIENNLCYIQLVKKGKNFGIFDGWKVVSSDFAKPWNITVPKGAKIKVDGVDVVTLGNNKTNTMGTFLSTNYSPETQVYVVDGIFPGDYEITASMDGAEPVKMKSNSQQPSTIKFQITKELVADLQKQTKSFLDIYYSKDGKTDKSKYDGLVSPDSNFIKNLSNSSSIFSNNYTLQRVDSFDVDLKNCSIDDIDHVKFTAIAKVYYEKEISWFFGDKQKQTGTNQVNLNLSFVKKDGKWLITDTGFMGF